MHRDFPGGSVADFLLPRQGARFNPWSGSEIPQAETKDGACRHQDQVQPNKYLKTKCAKKIARPPNYLKF